MKPIAKLFILAMIEVQMSCTSGRSQAIRPENPEVEKTFAQLETANTLSDADCKILLLALKDKDWRVREKAVKVFGRAQGAMLPYLPDIAAMFDDPVRNLSISTRETLIALGKKHPLFVHTYVKIARENSSVEVKSGVIRVLGVIGHTSEEAEQLIISELKNPSPKIRGAAVNSLGSFQSGAIAHLDKIEQMLDDPEQDVVVDALWAFSRIGPAALKKLPAIENHLRSPNRYARFAALQSISKIGRPSANVHPAIVSILKAFPDKDTSFKSRSQITAISLVDTWEIQSPELPEALIALLGTELDIAKNQHERKKMFADYFGLPDDSIPLRISIIRLMAKRLKGNRSAIAVIQEATKDPSASVVSTAKEALDLMKPENP